MHQYRLTPRVKSQKNNATAPDVMGYHTAAEIPNYWTYAQEFTLDDHMFEPVKSWSLPDHLFLVSGWSAKCKNKNPSSCKNNIVGPYSLPQFDNAVAQELATGTDRRRSGVDRPHLAPVQAPRLLGLLRADRRSARLRERLCARRARRYRRATALTASGTPCPSSPMCRPTISRRTSNRSTTSSSRPTTGRCHPCRG